MPISGRKKKKDSGKKHSGGGLFHGGLLDRLGAHSVQKAVSHELGRIGHSAVRDITGFPTAAYALAHASGTALQGHPEGLANIYKQIGESTYETGRHPVRSYEKDPFATLATALGAASGVGGLAGRGAAISSALKEGGGLRAATEAAMTKPVYTRTVKLPRKSASNLKAVRKVQLETSPNPLLRGLRKTTVDQLQHSHRYRQSLEKKLSDLSKQNVKNIAQPTKKVGKSRGGLAHPALTYPSDLFVRIPMYLRPRTMVQNALQTGMMLAHQQPLGIFKSTAQARKYSKNAPDVHEFVKGIASESAARSLSQGGVSRGPVGSIVQRLAEVSNYPESKMRPLSVYYEGRRRGVKSPEDWRDLMKHAQDDPQFSKQAALFHRISTAGKEGVGDFGRLSPRERMLMQTQIPIFYPMFKALTRYGARFPSEHSIQTAFMAQAGQEGNRRQREQLGPLPFWASYLVPAGKNRVRNPQNIFNFQPGVDIARQVAEMGRAGGPRPGVSLLAEAGPLPNLVYGAATGKDMATGYPLRGMSSKSNPLDIRRSAIAALRDQIAGTQPMQIYDLSRGGGGTPTKTYNPGSLSEFLGLQAIGPWAVSRGIKTKELHKQAKKEKTYGRPRRHHKKKHSDYGF